MGLKIHLSSGRKVGIMFPCKVRIRPTIKAYIKRDGSEQKTAIRDILTDLLHVCKKDGLDLDAILVGAKEVAAQEYEHK